METKRLNILSLEIQSLARAGERIIVRQRLSTFHKFLFLYHDFHGHGLQEELPLTC